MGPGFVAPEADSIQGNFLKENIQKYGGTGPWRSAVKERGPGAEASLAFVFCGEV